MIHWARRSGAEEGYTGLNPEAEGEQQTISSRLQAAAAVWGKLWAGGETYSARKGEALEPISGDQICDTLRRQGKGNAR